LFNSKLSSTFIDQGSSVSIGYGSGEIDCTNGSDIVNINGLQLNNFPFLSCFIVEVGDPIDGIMGFAYPSIS